MCTGRERTNGRRALDDAPSATYVPEWYDVRDLAGRYGTSTRHILRMADKGLMPWGCKLGHLRRWSRRDIEAWEAGGCKPVR